MEKVKITAEQERVMKRIDVYEGEPDVFDFLNKLTEQDFPYSKEISSNLDEQKEVRNIIKAFLHGYEVEPEFKGGDWVVYDNGKFHGYKTNKITSIEHGYALFGETQSMPLHTLRKATPQEIATEKTRRWWAKHDREVWELKKYDRLSRFSVHGVVEYNFLGMTSEGLYRLRKIGGTMAQQFSLDEILTYKIKVLCFAEDRKDI